MVWNPLSVVAVLVVAAVTTVVAAGALMLERRRRQEIQRLLARSASLESDLQEMATSAESRIAALEAERDEAAATSEATITELRRVWPLLLAGVERQWANAVAAGPGERGVTESSPSAQLEQAVERVLQRLREEVGVDTRCSGAAPALPAERATVVLLGVMEAVELLATRVETIDVRLGDPVVVTAGGWTGDGERPDVDAIGGDVRVVLT